MSSLGRVRQNRREKHHRNNLGENWSQLREASQLCGGSLKTIFCTNKHQGEGGMERKWREEGGGGGSEHILTMRRDCVEVDFVFFFNL